MQTSIGHGAEGHVLNFAVNKVAASRLSAFWRPMSDVKVLRYLLETLTNNLGLDTVWPL